MDRKFENVGEVRVNHRTARTEIYDKYGAKLHDGYYWVKIDAKAGITSRRDATIIDFDVPVTCNEFPSPYGPGLVCVLER